MLHVLLIQTYFVLSKKLKFNQVFHLLTYIRIFQSGLDTWQQYRAAVESFIFTSWRHWAWNGRDAAFHFPICFGPPFFTREACVFASCLIALFYGNTDLVSAQTLLNYFSCNQLSIKTNIYQRNNIHIVEFVKTLARRYVGCSKHAISRRSGFSKKSSFWYFVLLLIA